MILHPSSIAQTENQTTANEDFASAKFLRFLKHINLEKILHLVPDVRQQTKIKYPHTTLLTWALSVFFFRQESKHSLNSTISDLPPHKRRSISRFLGLENDILPKRDAVDDYLATISWEDINHLLLQIFIWAKQSKLFYNHANTLLPGNHFHLGCDGFWVHSYSKPHAVDDHGNNSCPYCLPRVYNKGKDNEYTEWVHAFVTFTLLFPHGFTLPIYIYPLKAAQVDNNLTEDKLKQECELLAVHKILPLLREQLGRISITVLLDSLYANEPMFLLLESLGFSYLITRQEESFVSIGHKCDELEQNELYQKHYRDYEIETCSNENVKEITCKWFNNVACGKESYVNVLRFTETTKNAVGCVTKKFQTEWLSSSRINKGNWKSLAQRARLRGDHEDMHNTLKNRGFAAKHDYARTNPNTCVIWKMIMIVAMAIQTLFNETTIGKTAKGSRSLMKFYKDLLQQLVEVCWTQITASPIYQKARIQFRFDFDPD